MKNELSVLVKKIGHYLPDVAFLCFCISCLINILLYSSEWNIPSIVFACLMIVLLFIQLLKRNKYVSRIIGSLFTLGSLYMYLALIDEVTEFPTGDPEGMKMLLVGFALITTFLILGIKMIIRK